MAIKERGEQEADIGYFLSEKSFLYRLIALKNILDSPDLEESLKKYYRTHFRQIETVFRHMTYDLERRLEIIGDEQHKTSNQIVSIEQARKSSRQQKTKGQSVGLVHGHYRTFSLGNLTLLAVARTFCDHLIVGVETGERTRRYKGAKPILEDTQREKLLLCADFVHTWFWINDDVDYSDYGYYRMIKTISPSTYFVNNDLSPSRLKEMERRAAEAETRLVRISTIPTLSTTSLIEKGMFKSER